MRFLRDRPIGHRASRKSLDNALDRLHLVQRNSCLSISTKFEKPTQCHQALALFVNDVCVFAKDIVTTFTRRVLKPKDRLGIK